MEHRRAASRARVDRCLSVGPATDLKELKPEPELCIKHPGYDEDIVITTDSRALTMIHLGRLSLADAERAGDWRVEGDPALVRGRSTWGGFYSRFAGIRPAHAATA